MTMENSRETEFVIFIIACCAMLIYGYISRKLKIASRSSTKNRSQQTNRALILSYYTKGYELKLINRDSIENMNYSIYTTSSFVNQNPDEPIQTNTEPGAMIYNLALPFNTQAHIVGISKKYTISNFLIQDYMLLHDLEGINLEGNFSDEFAIYARKDQGSITQYILDPAAMAFISDYCKNNFWEIVGDEMYIVSGADQQNGMIFLKDSLEFVRQIKPALIKTQSGEEPVHHELPYGVYDGGELPCPLCNKPMTVKEKWLECPDHDGILINGRYLVEMHDKKLQPPVSSAPKQHGDIKCPSCQSAMQRVNYQNNNIFIDTCPNCPFRWLDSDEAVKI